MSSVLERRRRIVFPDQTIIEDEEAVNAFMAKSETGYPGALDILSAPYLKLTPEQFLLLTATFPPNLEVFSEVNGEWVFKKRIFQKPDVDLDLMPIGKKGSSQRIYNFSLTTERHSFTIRVHMPFDPKHVSTDKDIRFIMEKLEDETLPPSERQEYEEKKNTFFDNLKQQMIKGLKRGHVRRL